MRIFIILTALFGFFTSFGSENLFELKVTVTKLRAGGILSVVLFNKDDGFPVKLEKGFQTIKISDIKTGSQTVIFKNLPKSRYAVAVFHDENSNGKIDTNWIGMPKEGIAVSNKAKGFMGPPSFKDASFVLDTEKAISIDIKYR